MPYILPPMRSELEAEMQQLRDGPTALTHLAETILLAGRRAAEVRGGLYDSKTDSYGAVWLCDVADALNLEMHGLALLILPLWRMGLLSLNTASGFGPDHAAKQEASLIEYGNQAKLHLLALDGAQAEAEVVVSATADPVTKEP